MKKSNDKYGKDQEATVGGFVGRKGKDKMT